MKEQEEPKDKTVTIIKRKVARGFSLTIVLKIRKNKFSTL